MLNQGTLDPEMIWIVTDLDGTLLDHHYDWSAAQPTLSWLKQLGIAVIPCTSKTAEEVQRFRLDAGLDGPYIVENGGAIHGGNGDTAWGQGLGNDHRILRDQLAALATRTGLTLQALEDLTPAAVTNLTGLQGEAVMLAQRRRWSVPFLNPPSELQQLVAREAAGMGLSVVQGNRMSHLLQAGTDKGAALQTLKQRLGITAVHVMALGDSPNDQPLLEVADHSVVVPGPNGPHPQLEKAIAAGRFALAPAPNAVGWASSVLAYVKGRVSPELAATAPEPPLDSP